MKTRNRVFCFVMVMFLIVIILVFCWNKDYRASSNNSKLKSTLMPVDLDGSSSLSATSNAGRKTKIRGKIIDLSSGNDILVYIHMQKTGGSHFLRHIVSATNNSRPICYKPTHELMRKLKKKRDLVFCPISSEVDVTDDVPEMWLVSEKTYGWVCGLHPFLIEMKDCVGSFLKESYGDRQRNFHYLSVIRHPVVRYISEFLHVQRGATWTYTHICNGIPLGDKIKKPCYLGYYSGQKWPNVTLEKFMACDSNWANNRQTIMLADLKTVNCLSKDTSLSKEEIETRLLESAKSNLNKLEFFAVSEYMEESGELFKYHFSLGLNDPPKQKGLQFLHSRYILYKVWNNSHLFRKIVRINRLDMELYQYALQLFEGKLQQINITIDHNKLDKEVFNLQNFVNSRLF